MQLHYNLRSYSVRRNRTFIGGLCLNSFWITTACDSDKLFLVLNRQQVRLRCFQEFGFVLGDPSTCVFHLEYGSCTFEHF